VRFEDSWKAAFHAGTWAGAVGKANNKVISKAQFERLLKKPRALTEEIFLLYLQGIRTLRST